MNTNDIDDRFLLLSALGVILLFVYAFLPVSAIPVTDGPATDIGSNNATLFMTGASTTCWFQYGMLPGNNMTWKSPNQTPSGGLCNYTIKGSPITPVTIFYYRACDVTGCGSDDSFTTAAVTAIPTSTYGSTFQNLSDNNFDITLIGASTMAPYMWVVPTLEGLVWALLFTGLLVGMWLRGRNLGYIAIFGVIISVMFLTGASYGLGIPVDSVFTDIGQGIMYATVAGVILALIKK